MKSKAGFVGIGFFIVFMICSIHTGWEGALSLAGCVLMDGTISE
jgi:hypothetical protein